MKRFYIYDATGAILRAGYCTENDLPLQAGPGESLGEGEASPRLHYVAGEEIKEFTLEELNARAMLRPGQRWKMPDRIVVDDRTLAQAKAQKLAEISRRCDTALEPIKAGYPASEQQTWDRQEREARAGGSTPLLSALAQARGLDLDELKARVLAKAEAFAAFSGAAIGRRQRCEDQIEAAQTVAEVDEIQWEEA
jgi:hypothetical protein